MFINKLKAIIKECAYEDDKTTKEIINNIVMCEECKIINTKDCIYASKNEITGKYKTILEDNDKYCYHDKK